MSFWFDQIFDAETVVVLTVTCAGIALKTSFFWVSDMILDKSEGPPHESEKVGSPHERVEEAVFKGKSNILYNKP